MKTPENCIIVNGEVHVIAPSDTDNVCDTCSLQELCAKVDNELGPCYFFTATFTDHFKKL